MNPDFSGSVENEVVELRARIGRIEEALRRRGVVLDDQPVAAQAGLAQSIATEPVAAQPVDTGQAPRTEPVHASVYAPPQAAAYQQTASAESAFSTPMPAIGVSQLAPETPQAEQSLENRIGSQWFNRIGILAVLIAMAWFLKLAIDNHWIGPLGRVLIGLVAGAGLIAWSERFRNRGYSVFSYSLKAVGSGVLYLSLWAAFSLFHLMPSGAAFAAMILVTAFNGFMAWVQDAELLALYAIVGGFGTPLLLSTGENHEVALLSYLLLLDVAVLILVALRPWSRLLFGAYAGTALILGGWWIVYYSDAQFGRTAFFVTCFFLIFAFAPRLVRVKDEGSIHGWDALAVLALPVANASLGFIAFYALLSDDRAEWAGPWLAVAFAAFYLLLLRLPAKGRLKASPPPLESLHLAAAVVFLTIAIPLKAKGRGLTVGWLAEGAALLWVAERVRSLLLRVLALGCLVLGLFSLLVVNTQVSTTPIFNARFGSYCVGIGVFAFVAWLAANARKQEGPEPALDWSAIAVGSALIVNALILIAVSLEIYSFWQSRNWSGNWQGLEARQAMAVEQAVEAHRIYAQFSYSAWFMLFGAILLGVGFWRRSAFLRWQALVLLAVSVGKVFLVDMSELSQGYRILSFLGLGVLLLAVSFVYQRDWLNLRGPKHAEIEQKGPAT
jgi:uncharacterized membrane protein